MGKVGYIGLAAIALGIASSAGAAIVTQWDFNGPDSASVPGGTASPTPSIGAGTASLVGGATATFASASSDGGSSDPAVGTPPDFAWNTTTYPAQGTGNNSRGVQFLVDTTGLSDDFTIMYDVRGSNTASRFIRLMYTTDGASYSSAGLTNDGVFEITGGPVFHNQIQFWFGGIAGVANNASFGFRIVTTFGPAGAYVPIGATSTYGTTGTLRYDMVTLFTPAPGALALLGAAAFVTRRRRA
ncbi:MAG: hypothetical protein FJ253_05340 [Phycisphaerae bacterium]|nr:hypothetical protein [Phycisphaerae bacterium]